METVKEFLDAGLGFCNLDIIASINGENGESKDFLNSAVTEFAWRKNTGEMPSYKGAVELMDGYHNTGIKFSGDVRWEMQAQAGDANIYKWRPVISKEDKTKGKTNEPIAYARIEIPDCAPIYTKEMHEAGEFKNGDKVRIPTQGDAVLTFIGVSAKYKTCILEFNDGSLAYELLEFIRLADTRTDEEKLIDDLAEWLKLIEEANASTYETKAKATITWLEEAGYRKP